MTTGALLCRILGEPDGHELLAWLRGLSFIESGPEGSCRTTSRAT